MSKIALSSHTSGTGTLTFAAPNTNSNRTLTLPDETGTVLSSVSDLTTQTKAALNASNGAPIYACRAWVNFNGTGTVAIRASGNVSSITDNGTGDYTVNFTTAMSDANYAFSVGSNNYNQSYPRATGLFGTTPAASNIRLKQAYTSTFGSVQTLEDTDYFTVAIFR